MIGIVYQLNFNRLGLGLVDDCDCQRTGRRRGRLGSNGCDRWLIPSAGWDLILGPLGIAIYLPGTIGDGPGTEVLGRGAVELDDLVDGLRHLGLGINDTNRAGDLGVGAGIGGGNVLGLRLGRLVSRRLFDQLVFDRGARRMAVRIVHRVGIINRKNGITLPPVIFREDLVEGVKPIGNDLIIAWGVAGVVITPGLTSR